MDVEKVLLKLQSSSGGWNRAALEELGVRWPPKKGWKKKLIANEKRKLKAIIASGELSIKGDGYLFRRTKTGRMHIVINGAPACRTTPNANTQVFTRDRADIAVCKACENALVNDPKNKRKDRKTRRKDGSQFYSSWEWKKLRFEVLKAYGAKCMLCGSDERIVVDHIKPRSKFPALQLDYSNMQVLCNSCNRGKSNDDYTDFRPQSEELASSDYAELEHIADTSHLH